jgi:hypothetical protein
LLLPSDFTVQGLGRDPASLWALDGFGTASDPQGLRCMQACFQEVAATKIKHDSFAMHAPLELMGRLRIGVLCAQAWSEPTWRLAHIQAVATALAYREQGQASQARPAAGGAANALSVMQQAIDKGDVAAAQSAAMAVAAHALPGDVIQALAPDWVQRLACGAHAHIFLSHLAHVQAVAPTLARQALQALPIFAGELARHPSHRVTASSWVSSAPAVSQAVPALRSALLGLMPLPAAVSGGIQAIVQQTLVAGVARDLMALLPSAEALSSDRLWAECMAAVCEVPLRAMLEDAPSKAKYGWTHALTLPLATLHLAEMGALQRHLALSMAALQVASFRSVIGTGPLPEHPLSQAQSGLEPVMDETFEGLFAQACTRPDAHLVKYVLACQDLGQMAPSLERLGRHAAKHLTAIWVQEQPDAGLLTSLSLR